MRPSRTTPYVEAKSAGWKPPLFLAVEHGASTQGPRVVYWTSTHEIAGNVLPRSTVIAAMVITVPNVRNQREKRKPHLHRWNTRLPLCINRFQHAGTLWVAPSIQPRKTHTWWKCARFKSFACDKVVLRMTNVGKTIASLFYDHIGL